jgi:hypothetical protein
MVVGKHDYMRFSGRGRAAGRCCPVLSSPCQSYSDSCPSIRLIELCLFTAVIRPYNLIGQMIRIMFLQRAGSWTIHSALASLHVTATLNVIKLSSQIEDTFPCHVGCHGNQSHEFRESHDKGPPMWQLGV